MLVIMLVLMPPVTKVFMKASHGIFGKPSNSELDEMEGKKEEEQKDHSQGMNKKPDVSELFQKVANKQNVQGRQTSQNPFVNMNKKPKPMSRTPTSPKS